MYCTVILSLCLITTALIVVVLGLDVLPSVQIQLRSTVSTIYISCIFVNITKPVGTFPPLIVLLYSVKELTADYRLMSVLKYKYVFGIVFEPLFKLVGFAIGTKVDSVAAIYPV